MGLVVRVVIAVVGCLSVRPALAQSNAASRRGGMIMVTQGTRGGRSASSADAVFGGFPLWGDVIGSDGRCTVHTRAPTAGLSGGTIRITGTTQPITLEESAVNGGVKYKRTGVTPDPAFADGATLRVETSGGSDIPAFAATVTAPAKLTGYTPPTALSRAGYTATWTAGTDAEILILVGAIGRQRNDGVTVICRVPDTGTFTVPASTFELIPASDDHAIVIVGRIAETVATMADARVTFDVLSAVGSGVLVLAQTPARATTEVVAPCPCETSPRLYISFSTGFGGASRVGVTPPVGGFSWRLQVAERLAHGLHLVEEYNEIGSDYLSPAPIGTSEDHGSIGVGVRWTPFEPQPRPSHFPFAPYMDVHAFYLTAVVGADVRDRLAQTSPTQTTDQTAWSPMASLALGVLELQGHDWSIGPEFREQLARFDGHFQRGWQLLFAIHLNQW